MKPFIVIEIVEIWDVMNFQQCLIMSTEPDLFMLNYLTCLKGEVNIAFNIFGLQNACFEMEMVGKMFQN